MYYKRRIRTLRKTYPFSVFLHSLIIRAIFHGNNYLRKSTLKIYFLPTFPRFLLLTFVHSIFLHLATFPLLQIIMLSYLLHKVITESIRVGNFFLILSSFTFPTTHKTITICIHIFWELTSCRATQCATSIAFLAQSSGLPWVDAAIILSTDEGAGLAGQKTYLSWHYKGCYKNVVSLAPKPTF